MVDIRLKIKKNIKRYKYLNLARELEQGLWKMTEKVIPIVIGALGMPPTSLGEVDDRV